MSTQHPLYPCLFGAALLVGLFCLAPLAGANQDAAKPAISAPSRASFAVSGAVEKPGTWTVERLTKQFASQVQPVEYVLKGKKSTARCVPLTAVLDAAAPRLNPKQKNHALAFTVLVRARDGYAVSFSWAEIAPDMGKRPVWVALDRDGAPLGEKDGPVELVVPGDQKPSRWVHGVAQIVVTDGLAR